MRKTQIHATLVCFVVLSMLALVPALAQSAIEVKNGRTCIGTGCTDAVATAEVRTSDNSTKLLVNEPAASSSKVLMELRMPGQPQFLMRNTTSSQAWNIKASPQGLRFAETSSTKGTMEIKKSGAFLIGNGGSQVSVTPSGDMTIGGILTENSDRAAKRDIAPVDGGDVLSRLAEVPIATWNYRDNPRGIRHMGPMAQDFHRTFGLGKNDKGISAIDMGGVALAAIQELSELTEEKDRRIQELEAEQAQLAAELAEMRGMVEKLLVD